MGFCRHCGNIVAGARCSTCGGAAVAPAVSFKKTSSLGNQDKWLKTYASAEVEGSAAGRRKVETGLTNSNAAPQPMASTSTSKAPMITPVRRFPLPKTNVTTPVFSLQSGVSEHITSATSVSSPRPPSPLKLSTTLSDTENDILPSFSPHEPSLSKVYGSVLQPKDTLTLHSCAICATTFSPDATIYPNPIPTESNKRSFLCKTCFTENGGSKGNCPACSRPVLALKSEGAYIQSGGKFWHKQCYNCAGCFKNIGNAPMVDLLGRPSCVDCFDNCLKRDHPTTPKRNRTRSTTNSPNFSNPGGLNSSYGPGKPNRENSPALEELEQRLGLAKARDTSSPRVSASPKKLTGTSPPRSPLRNRPTAQMSGYTRDSDLKTSEMDVANLASSSTAYQTLTLEDLSLSPGVSSSSPLSLSASNSSNTSLSLVRPTTRPDIHDPSTFVDDIMSQGKGSVGPSSQCNLCGQAIVNTRDSGQFVTIPGADENAVPQMFHSECFRCAVCSKSLSESRRGSAAFITTHRGPCHIQCTSSEQIVIQKQKPPSGIPDWVPTIPQDLPSWSSKKLNIAISPHENSEATTSAVTPFKLASPRFGGQSSCPGCHKAVSSMERGVVPGPQGSRWHSSCLVCGGKKEATRSVLLGRVRDDTKKVGPGCGKKLDSAAKIDGEGGIWCRECLLFAGVGGSPQGSPTKTSSICIPGKIVTPQFTGSTTLARQFTGIGAHDPVLRQLTGGGLSPTRSISPTKQLGLMGGGRPRPKSVIGSIRHTKAQSIDEGRGMFLVRQMTGTASSGGWGER